MSDICKTLRPVPDMSHTLYTNQSITTSQVRETSRLLDNVYGKETQDRGNAA